MPIEQEKTILGCMNTNIIVTDSSCGLLEVLDKMRTQKAQIAVIQDSDGLLGVFAEEDLLFKVDLKNNLKNLPVLCVKDVMEKNQKTISSGNSYLAAIQSMQSSHVNRLIVVDNGKPVGFIPLSEAMPYYEEKLEDLNLELFEKNQQLLQKTRKLNAIMRLSEQLISNMETQELLSHIAKVSRELVHADTASIILLRKEENDFSITAAEFTGSDIKSEVIKPSLDENESLTGWVVRNKQPLLLYGQPKDDPRFKGIKWKEGIRCSINVPLLYKDSVKGTLNLNIVDSDYRFSQEDLETAIVLANHVTVAIENSNLFKGLQDSLIEYLRVANEKMKVTNDELKMAQRRIDNEIKTVAIVQRGLLPKTLPKSSSVEVAAIYAASRTVGGDYYDCLEMKDGKLGIVIADVTGHGLAAAFVMTMIKILLFYLNQRKISLVETVSTINGMLDRYVPISTYASLVYGIFDPERMTFEYINAGHEPILCINPTTQKKEFYFAKSLLLGVEPDAEFTVETIKLSKGDRMFLYTDGVSESMNPKKELFGRVRVADVVSSHISETPQAIIDALMQELNSFRDGVSPSDDLTMLVFRF